MGLPPFHLYIEVIAYCVAVTGQVNQHPHCAIWCARICLSGAAGPLVGPVVRRPCRDWRTWVRFPTFAVDLFPGRILPVSSKVVLQWIPCQAQGVSTQCMPGWDRRLWSATSLSFWQHVQLPEQIRLWDTQAYCWEVKQLTNNCCGSSCCPVKGQTTAFQVPFHGSPPCLPGSPSGPLRLG